MEKDDPLIMSIDKLLAYAVPNWKVLDCLLLCPLVVNWGRDEEGGDVTTDYLAVVVLCCFNRFKSRFEVHVFISRKVTTAQKLSGGAQSCRTTLNYNGAKFTLKFSSGLSRRLSLEHRCEPGSLAPTTMWQNKGTINEFPWRWSSQGAENLGHLAPGTAKVL